MRGERSRWSRASELVALDCAGAVSEPLITAIAISGLLSNENPTEDGGVEKAIAPCYG